MSKGQQKEYGQDELRDLIAHHLGEKQIPRRFKVIYDTSEFFHIDYNDVVVLAGRPYLMRSYEREGRFGLDDEPKYWVRRAVDLTSGSLKIIKLVFDETIEAKVGGIVFRCVRSPQKEAAILELVRGDPRFMQGVSAADSVGNTVRILDFIEGERLDDVVFRLCGDHEEYYFNELPALLESYVELVAAIQLLHRNGYKHGDIRRDHVLYDKASEGWRWLDFDYDYVADANIFGYDLFGLGNILTFLAGGGDVTLKELSRADSPALRRLEEDDLGIVFNNRVVNLQKVFPYLHDSLAYVLRHFSKGANLFYEETDQILADLREVVFD